MITGIGLEIVDVGPFQDFLEGRTSSVDQAHYTDRELAYCRDKRAGGQHLAARYAAKTATCKALGLAPDTWRAQLGGIEVVRAQGGQPGIRLSDDLRSRVDAGSPATLHLSISHAANQAVALVVVEKRELSTGDDS